MFAARRSLTIAGLLAAALLSIVTRRAEAFGPEGHRAVAMIAEDRLSADAKKEVRDLLDGAFLSSVANDADHFGPENPKAERGPWHFIDIPVGAKREDLSDRAIRRGGSNVVDRIDAFRKVLADRTKRKAERREALAYLVHFVGDLHQPLHCAERKNADGETDHGGNDVFVKYPDLKPSLHKVWDGGLIRLMLDPESKRPWLDFAQDLSAELAEEHGSEPARIRAWADGTTEDWAWESHRLAVTVAYADIPRTTSASRPFVLDEAYVTKAKATIREQLKKAGYRLAFVLNEALKSP